MPRVKKYNREMVLEKAANLFWMRGFEATSMDDLVKVTGLNTFSLYREFSSKKGLFKAAMDWYYQNVLCYMTSGLKENQGVSSIREFLNMFPSILASKNYHGCLFMNSLIEKKSLSKEINNRVNIYCNEMLELLQACIRKGQNNGEIDPERDPVALAEYILCFIQGFVLYGRLRKKRETVQKLVDTILQNITTKYF